MERYICVHGHFYQPPRENPWLEAVELQHSAYPYHDWNERISAECYEPNSTSRILDSNNNIIQIADNYSKISFNFGPTLLSWLENNAPAVYVNILLSDLESQKLFSGHGSALAQVYNHIIMPLSNHRDRYTQVMWGIKDFEHRFNRQPEGMWLPETAVDIKTLDILAELGLKFTILAPHQAGRVRRIGAANWRDVGGGRIDPTRAYEVHLPSGRKLSVFFYDGPISRAVAFEGLLSNGEGFANRLMSGFSDRRNWPQLVNIATDGESYGHHHHFGDMALAYALHNINVNSKAKITNYGEYLAKHRPTHEVEIIEKTSWSCSHGIERWWKDCGCNSGGHPGWSQAWRTPLRNALDWLRDTIAPRWEERARHFLKDPWGARNDYIRVVLDRSPDNVGAFLSQHASRKLGKTESIEIIKLLELQRHTMLMYTSCGWFFDELSGIETVQVMQYAGRVVQLAEELLGNNTEQKFLTLLEAAKSNIPEHGDGRRIYEKFVKPSMVDLTKVAAHYAISSLFEKYGAQAKIYCYTIDAQDYQNLDFGKVRLAVGRAIVTSLITQESQILSFGALHFGDHNVNAGVRNYLGDEAYKLMVQELIQSCSIADFAGFIRLLDKHFGISTYSIKSLFRDEQQKVLGNILKSTLAEMESGYRQIYKSNYSLMRFLTDLGNPLPRAFQSAAEFILNTDLKRAVASDNPDIDNIKRLLDDINLWKVQLDIGGIEYALRQTVQNKMFDFVHNPENIERMNQVKALIELAKLMPFNVNLRVIQNIYYDMPKAIYDSFKREAEEGEQTARDWVAQFNILGQLLSIQKSG